MERCWWKKEWASFPGSLNDVSPKEIGLVNQYSYWRWLALTVTITFLVWSEPASQASQSSCWGFQLLSDVRGAIVCQEAWSPASTWWISAPALGWMDFRICQNFKSLSRGREINCDNWDNVQDTQEERIFCTQTKSIERGQRQGITLFT